MERTHTGTDWRDSERLTSNKQLPKIPKHPEMTIECADVFCTSCCVPYDCKIEGISASRRELPGASSQIASVKMPTLRATSG